MLVSFIKVVAICWEDITQQVTVMTLLPEDLRGNIRKQRLNKKATEP